MSTICLINPNIRRQRARRRDAVREMFARAVTEQGPTRFQLRAIAEKLNAVRKNSALPGWFKEQMFFRIVGRFYANVHEFAKQAEARRESAELLRRQDEPWYRKLAKKAKGWFTKE